MKPKDLTWDEFEQRLIAAGWSPVEAKAERESQEHGHIGDCDGDTGIIREMRVYREHTEWCDRCIAALFSEGVAEDDITVEYRYNQTSIRVRGKLRFEKHGLAFPTSRARSPRTGWWP